MGCYGCGRKNTALRSNNIMEQYKYLNDRQLKARLEVYKKKYCKECEKASKCDYTMYLNCKKNNE